MKVTIAIPAYNQAEFLPEAIESAINQTIPCEIIVVNDGSPDNTLEVAKQYPVKIIDQVNKGLASARNTAIMNMTGDYLMPLDSDDMLIDTCVEELLTVAEKTGADIIAPSFKTFGTSDEVVTLQYNPSIEDFRTHNRIGYFSMIKKEALLECGGYSPRMVKGWEDYHLWFDLLSRGKQLVTVQKPLVLYRTKEKSMWLDSVKHSKELWDQIFKDFPHLLPKEIQTI